MFTVAFAIGQSLVTAVITSALTTHIVLKTIDGCRAARDIRGMLWWEKNLQEMEWGKSPLNFEEPKGGKVH